MQNTALKDAEEHCRLTSLLWQPAIPFDPKHGKAPKDKGKGSKKDDDSSDDEAEKITLYVKINADDDLTEGNTVAPGPVTNHYSTVSALKPVTAPITLPICSTATTTPLSPLYCPH